MSRRRLAWFWMLWAVIVPTWAASDRPSLPGPGGSMLQEYFRAQTAKLGERCLRDLSTLEAWKSQREEYRRQLLEMLGLWPWPTRGDLRAVVTGKLEAEDFTVEKLHFQSMPGLYVTGNLYLPKRIEKLAPAVLYLCGHAEVVTNGISCGNKTAYQHHGVWFARNGYVCLMLDTIQLGELRGLHHGTYREGMWWWNARGYTPAGVEAWNGVRALDYLQGRAEVDPQRLGVTGRSGGGAYSWWLAAIDERVKVAAPVAGITDLENHVVDGAVEGHCDCMFMVNTYRWDYPQVAALLAPRPLLMGNSDKDPIFPLDGVVRLHAKVRGVYALYQATNQLGLLITEGPHRDTQDLQLPVFRWFNRHLKREDPLIEMAATRRFQPLELRVFEQNPADQRTTNTHEFFVPPAAATPHPASRSAWETCRGQWLGSLRKLCFGGWPETPTLLDLKRLSAVAKDGLRLETWEFSSEPGIRLRLYVASPTSAGRTTSVTFHPLDEAGWVAWLSTMRGVFGAALASEAQASPGVATDSDVSAFQALRDYLRAQRTVMAWCPPRGVGLTAWSQDPPRQAQIRRRFMLLGQTLDGMRVWDLKRALEAVRELRGIGRLPVSLRGVGAMGLNAVYASLFAPAVVELQLLRLPATHRDGPDYLNVLRVLDAPQALALTCERHRVSLYEADAGDWRYALELSERMGWGPDRLALHRPGSPTPSGFFAGPPRKAGPAAESGR